MSFRDGNVSRSAARKRVAVVIANPAFSSTTGWPVGFWWSELTHPCLAFEEAGYGTEVFSPDGGRCTADALSDPNDASGYSSSDLVTQGFIHTPALRAPVDATRSVRELDSSKFDAILRYARLPGGELLARGRHVMPWCSEDELKALGANYLQAGLWRSFAVRDGHLVTGQQNFSGAETARLVIESPGR